jgi:hypothetical protein
MVTAPFSTNAGAIPASSLYEMLTVLGVPAEDTETLG